MARENAGDRVYRIGSRTNSGEMMQEAQLKPMLRAMTESGESWNDPSEDALFMFLEDVERGEEKFLIVERLADSTGQTYIQSARNDDGSYVVEYRDGSADQHFSTSVADVRAAHALITSWAFAEPHWRDSFEWSRISFDS